MNKGSIAGIFLVIYFLAVVLVAFMFADTQPLIVVMAMGSLFLVFGLIGIFSGKGSLSQKLPLLIFPLVGGGMIAGPAIYMYQEKHPEMEKIITPEMMPKLFLLLFLFIGIAMLAGSIFDIVHKQLTCTEAVEATCIELVARRGNKGRLLYAPVWSYYFDGREWIVEDSVATNVGYPREGEQRTLYVNPENPEKYRGSGMASKIIMIIIGLMFTGMSLLALFSMSVGQS